MERLHYFTVFEDNKEDEKEKDIKLPENQNDIPGSSPDEAISLFEADKGNYAYALDSIPGYNFIMASEKRELWILEGRECHLVGMGSPFGKQEYVDYINTLPKFAASMVAERIEHYGFTERPDSFMFGINGTVRVLNAYNEKLYYIAYPNEKVDYEMVSNLNDQTINDKFKAWMEKVLGKKMFIWIRKKIEQHQR